MFPYLYHLMSVPAVAVNLHFLMGLLLIGSAVVAIWRTTKLHFAQAGVVFAAAGLVVSLLNWGVYHAVRTFNTARELAFDPIISRPLVRELLHLGLVAWMIVGVLGVLVAVIFTRSDWSQHEPRCGHWHSWQGFKPRPPRKRRTA